MDKSNGWHQVTKTTLTFYKKAGVMLPLSPGCPALHGHHQHLHEGATVTTATTAATNLCVNGFAASLLSPDATFQFSIQDMGILLVEWQVVSLHSICKNGWLRDNVAFLAFYFGRQTLSKARNFPGYRKSAQRLNRCQAVMIIFFPMSSFPK